MITDLFLNRHTQFNLTIPKALFVQLFNLFDDPNIGMHAALLEKIKDYPYSNYADEHIRIISQSMAKFCNELGYDNLDKAEYIQPDWGFNDYRIFKNYIFDELIPDGEKLSFIEILFRDTEKHLLSEVDFLKTRIPQYEARSREIQELSRSKATRFYNDGEEKLKSAVPQLEIKKVVLEKIQNEINQRLKLSQLPLSYHNGYFQNSADPVIEQHIVIPFWNSISDPKYKNVETDILEALDRYDSGDRDPAFYAAKALESMIKIICDEKGFTTGNENGAVGYISHLNSTKNGPIVINDEKEELVSMFRIRNAHSHGAGSEPMPVLTNQQVLRYIHSAMVWISNLAKR